MLRSGCRRARGRRTRDRLAIGSWERGGVLKIAPGSSRAVRHDHGMRGGVGGTEGGSEATWRGSDVVDCQSSSSDVLDSSVDDNRCASCGSSLATCVDGDLHALVIGRRP